MSEDAGRLLHSASDKAELRRPGDESDLVVYAVHLVGTRANDERIVTMEAAHPLALDPEPLHWHELQSREGFGVAVEGYSRKTLMEMFPIGKGSQRSEAAGKQEVRADHRTLR